MASSLISVLTVTSPEAATPSRPITDGESRTLLAAANEVAPAMTA